jgi:hypothetical protein
MNGDRKAIVLAETLGGALKETTSFPDDCSGDDRHYEVEEKTTHYVDNRNASVKGLSPVEQRRTINWEKPGSTQIGQIELFKE